MTAQKKILIYGSYGYTGSLVANLAKERGLAPILAGQNPEKISAQSKELGLEGRAFRLNQEEPLKALQDIFLVIHCAGPFSHTHAAMVDACLKTGSHYSDITGEIEVFEALAKRSDEAKKAGIMLLPGAGFDVVPSDCLAAHLKSRLPSATHLALAFKMFDSKISRGTAKTIVENLHQGGMIRQNGVLTKIPSASKTRKINFKKNHETEAIAVPWGDVSTAYYSTGIPNIEVYTSMPPMAKQIMTLAQPFGFFLSSNLVQKGLKKLIDQLPPGPNAEEREKASCLVWGEARDEKTGKLATSQLLLPEGYKLTALTALLIAEKISSGKAPLGFQTPSLAFGKDLILEIEGTSREDLGAIEPPKPERFQREAEKISEC